MSKRVVNIGSAPNDGTGDSLRNGMDKINENFTEIYNTFGNGTTLDISSISDATTLDGEDGSYYLNYNNFVNTPIDLSDFNNSVGFVTASIVDGYATETYVTNSLVGYATETFVNTGLTLKANLTGANFTGVVSATQFVGDGSGLSGITAIGSGIEIEDDGTLVGTAVTVNFGSNITVAVSAGVATANVQVPTVYFDSNPTGIHTLSNVGIGTTNAESKLTVSGDVNISGVTTITGNYFYVGNPDVTSNITSGVILDTSGKITHQSVGGETHIVGYSGSSISYALSKDGNLYLGGGNPDDGGTGGNITILGETGRIGIGSTLPSSALEVGPVGAVTTSLTVNGYASINGANVITWPDATDTRQSIYIGQGSGSTLAGGYYNVALGTRALEECGVGDNSNIAIGYQALRYGGGDANVVIGANAADSSSFSGTANVVIGKDAGTAMTSAFSNTLIGYAAGDSITTGDYNIFIGRDSGASITTGNRNVIIGGYGGTGSVSDDPAYPGYYEGSLNLADSTANIVIADGYGTVKMYINPEGNVGIATTNPTSKLTVSGGANISGVVTASAFVGDGSGLTGVNAVGTGISVFDSSSLIGVATAIDFGDNLSVSAVSAGLVTVTATGGGGGGESYWVSTAAGIHTLSNVGVGTTNPQTPLQVENVYGIKTGSGTFTASAGVAHTADSYGVSDFVNAEYTLFFQHSSGIQSQKVLVMDDGTTAYSQEYGIMNSSDLLVSVGATVKSSNVELWWTPETGVTGIMTYRYTRETMI